MGMLRQSFWRVAAVAALLFAVPVVLTGALVEVIGVDRELTGVGLTVALSALAVAGFLRLFGAVVFAGFLDEAVGRQYLFGEPERFVEVIRRLPWMRLLVADVLLGLGTAIGFTLLVVPGIAVYALFGLVGPVMVQERLGLAPAFRRTYRLSRPALRLVVALVVIPVAFEHALHEVLAATVESAGLGVRVLAEWLAAVVLGATIGLIEVALAAELIARNPPAVSATEPAARS
jgi:hypothetical protein